jgi:SPP1 family predicted phage head-tail adaptor
MTGIGELNRRLTLQEPVETADGAGGVTRTYADVATVWARIDPVSARYDIVAAGAGATVTHRITIRSGPDVTTRHRFTEGARVYRVVAVRDADATRRFRVIHAEERSA